MCRDCVPGWRAQGWWCFSCQKTVIALDPCLRLRGHATRLAPLVSQSSRTSQLCALKCFRCPECIYHGGGFAELYSRMSPLEAIAWGRCVGCMFHPFRTAHRRPFHCWQGLVTRAVAIAFTWDVASGADGDLDQARASDLTIRRAAGQQAPLVSRPLRTSPLCALACFRYPDGGLDQARDTGGLRGRMSELRYGVTGHVEHHPPMTPRCAWQQVLPHVWHHCRREAISHESGIVSLAGGTLPLLQTRLKLTFAEYQRQLEVRAEAQRRQLAHDVSLHQMAVRAAARRRKRLRRAARARNGKAAAAALELVGRPAVATWPSGATQSAVSADGISAWEAVD